MSKKILGIDLDKLIREALNDTFPQDEKRMQAQKAAELKGFKSSKKSSKKDDDVDEDDAANVETVKSPPKVKASKLIELLNLIRSGQSLNDESTRKSFQIYFDALSGSERIALFSFLEAIADVVSGVNDEIDAKNEPQPDDYGVQTKIVKDKKPKRSKIEKARKSDKEKEDNAPIVVGESANKSKELLILKGNK